MQNGGGMRPKMEKMTTEPSIQFHPSRRYEPLWPSTPKVINLTTSSKVNTLVKLMSRMRRIALAVGSATYAHWSGRPPVRKAMLMQLATMHRSTPLSKTGQRTMRRAASRSAFVGDSRPHDQYAMYGSLSSSSEDDAAAGFLSGDSAPAFSGAAFDLSFGVLGDFGRPPQRHGECGDFGSFPFLLPLHDFSETSSVILSGAVRTPGGRATPSIVSGRCWSEMTVAFEMAQHGAQVSAIFDDSS